MAKNVMMRYRILCTGFFEVITLSAAPMASALKNQNKIVIGLIIVNSTYSIIAND
jgi:hypothetical protein